MEYTVGQIVGDYEILEILGAGGMGRVYKVRNIISQRVEAMKVLLADLEGNPELFDRFLREIRVLAALNHPNIAGLHTALRSGNQVIMLMEYVEGESLDKIMRRGRIALPQVVQLVQETLSALHYAHQSSVVHRDIKPANIMVDRQGKARLTDFGIALAAKDQRLTQTGHTLGSLFYMSPEQIQGEPNIDGRSDLYSLGITLYEMATGRRPFHGESDFSIMAAHLHSPPTPPADIDSQVPPALSQIILASIAKDPAQRFQTADAMRQALNHVFPAGPSDQGETAPLTPRPAVTQPNRPQASTPPPVSAATPAPAVRQAPPPQEMKKGSGTRLLWLLAGSLVTVAVLVIAAIQLPKVASIFAGPAKPPQNTAQVQPSSTVTPEQVPPPRVDPQPDPVPAPIDPAPTRQTAPVPPRSPGTPPQRATAPAPKPQGNAQQGTAMPVPPVQSAPETQAPQPTVPSASAGALREQRNRMIEIATRTGPIRRSLDRLRQQQARSGLGMRRDFEAAEQRLVNMLDDAEDAIKQGNAASAEKFLDGAEASLRFLETNLGG